MSKYTGIHRTRDFDDYEEWEVFDENGGIIFYKNNKGVEQHSRNDDYGNQLEFKQFEKGKLTQHALYEYERGWVRTSSEWLI